MLTNEQWYQLVYNNYANFKAIMPKVEAGEYETVGVTALNQIPEAKDMLIGLSYVWTTQQVYAAGYDHVFYQYVRKFPGTVGQYIRRINVRGNKPGTAPYNNLENGKSVDQQRVRLNVLDEYFFQYNTRYYNTHTILDRWQYDQVLNEPYGISNLIPEISRAQAAEYANWQDAMALRTLNKGFHDPNKPQKATQVQYVGDFTDWNDQNWLRNFVYAVRRTVTSMTKAKSGNFNQYNFAYKQDPASLILVTKIGLSDALAMQAMTEARSFERLGLNVEVVEVPNFGDLQPYASEESTTPLYEVFGQFGEVIGYAATENATTPTYMDTDDPKLNPSGLPLVVWKADNPTEIARLYTREALFTLGSKGRQVRYAPHNEAGLYQTIHEHDPHVLFGFDQRYNNVSFYASNAPGSTRRAKKS